MGGSPPIFYLLSIRYSLLSKIVDVSELKVKSATARPYHLCFIRWIKANDFFAYDSTVLGCGPFKAAAFPFQVAVAVATVSAEPEKALFVIEPYPLPHLYGNGGNLLADTVSPRDTSPS